MTLVKEAPLSLRTAEIPYAAEEMRLLPTDAAFKLPDLEKYREPKTTYPMRPFLTSLACERLKYIRGLLSTINYCVKVPEAPAAYLNMCRDQELSREQFRKGQQINADTSAIQVERAFEEIEIKQLLVNPKIADRIVTLSKKIRSGELSLDLPVNELANRLGIFDRGMRNALRTFLVGNYHDDFISLIRKTVPEDVFKNPPPTLLTVCPKQFEKTGNAPIIGV